MICNVCVLSGRMDWKITELKCDHLNGAISIVLLLFSSITNVYEYICRNISKIDVTNNREIFPSDIWFFKTIRTRKFPFHWSLIPINERTNAKGKLIIFNRRRSIKILHFFCSLCTKREKKKKRKKNTPSLRNATNKMYDVTFNYISRENRKNS